MSIVEERKHLAEVLAEALKIPMERAEKILDSKSVRPMRYKNYKYIALRREVADHPEGTIILVSREGYRIIEGYPSIERILLLSKAVPRHFIDLVVVEEKMDGYNVRTIRVDGEILAVTRGGFICPYTTSRMRRKYGGSLGKLFDELGDDAVLVGEVVGMENPYTRYYYPEAPYWDYFVFDVYVKGKPLKIRDRRRIIEEHGLRNVPQLGVVDKDSWQDILELSRGLESAGREGVVLKDPENRVPPLKYTTSYINARDVQEGMKYPFDEGYTFIFPRLLRQIFKAYEEEWDRERMREEARRFGEALLQPALDSIKRYVMGEPLAEEFILEFETVEELEEFVSYTALMGVPVTVVSVDKVDSAIKVKLLKHKKTPDYYKRILKTGLSPLD